MHKLMNFNHHRGRRLEFKENQTPIDRVKVVYFVLFGVSLILMFVVDFP